MQLEWAKIYIAQNRPFFTHLGAQKLIVRELLKYDFRPEFDGILQYFFPPQFYPKHLYVNKPEKEIPQKTAR